MQKILSWAVSGQLLWQSIMHWFGAIHAPCWPGTALWHLRWLTECSFHFDKPLSLSKHPRLPKPASSQMQGRVTPMGRFPVFATLHCSFHSHSNSGICSLCRCYSHPQRPCCRAAHEAGQAEQHWVEQALWLGREEQEEIHRRSERRINT